MDPSNFSVRLDTRYLETSRFRKNCVLKYPSEPGLEDILASTPTGEIKRLRQGVTQVPNMYSYYRRRLDLPENPLVADILPDGGAVHAHVHAIGERASCVLWLAFEEEIKSAPKVIINDFL